MRFRTVAQALQPPSARSLLIVLPSFLSAEAAASFVLARSYTARLRSEAVGKLFCRHGAIWLAPGKLSNPSATKHTWLGPSVDLGILVRAAWCRPDSKTLRCQAMPPRLPELTILPGKGIGKSFSLGACVGAAHQLTAVDTSGPAALYCTVRCCRLCPRRPANRRWPSTLLGCDAAVCLGLSFEHRAYPTIPFLSQRVTS